METIPEDNSQSNTELWSSVPVDMFIEQFLHKRFKEHGGREDKKIVGAIISGSLL